MMARMGGSGIWWSAGLNDPGVETAVACGVAVARGDAAMVRRQQRGLHAAAVEAVGPCVARDVGEGPPPPRVLVDVDLRGGRASQEDGPRGEQRGATQLSSVTGHRTASRGR